jgi:hypothetical protein
VRSRCTCQQRRLVRGWDVGWNLAEKGVLPVYSEVLNQVSLFCLNSGFPWIRARDILHYFATSLRCIPSYFWLAFRGNTIMASEFCEEDNQPLPLVYIHR